MKSKNLLGKNISLLGMGTMRLPLKDKKTGEIDLEEFQKMIDYSMKEGVNYYDTAYIYHGGKSEVAVRECLVKKYPRDSYYLADKLSLWLANKKEDYEKMFNEQLERAGVDFFDFYLVHSLDREKMIKGKEFGAFEFVKKKQEEGKVKHMGFSFHGDYETFKEIVEEYHEIIEFVQLQINYLDYKIIESDKCYELAKKYNLKVIIMEPIKGGTLANYPDEIKEMFVEKDEKSSIASWALRYCGSLDNAFTVLSGMSNIEHVKDNIKTFKNFKDLEKEDYRFLEKVLEQSSKYDTIKCTKCDYCIECPVNINISGVFTLYNDIENSPQTAWNSKAVYKGSMPVQADVCIECKKCEKVCPQKIDIIDKLKEAHKKLTT